MAIIKTERDHAPNRILLIEDDPAVAMVFRHVLKTLNPDTELHWHPTFQDGLRTLDNEGRFAVIICDHQLGGQGTGLDLWKRWRSDPRKTPFIMISAMSPSVFFALVGSGNMSPFFLPKPIPPQRCFELLSQFIPPKPRQARSA